VSAARALVVNSSVTIPRSELTFRATRAGGPGGQHVNTSSTRVELLWNVRRSGAISPEDRARLLDRLASRLDGDGNLRVVSSEHRSQTRNREAAEDRLADVVRRALVVRRVRRRTRPPRSAVEGRIREKKQRGEKKRDRSRHDFD
jgi:ribosome-associated protein